MEQWRNGRRELCKQIENICNNIEQNLTHELVDGENTIIRKDELESLHSRLKASETDKKNYAAQVESNENTLREERSNSRNLEQLFHNAASQVERLEEMNRNLKKELKKYQNVPSRVGDLEQQNKELSMSRRQSNYKQLRNDYTRVKEQWSTQKERADKLAAELRETKAALRQWIAWSDAQQVHSKSKLGRSNAQMQEMRKLRLRFQESEGDHAPMPGPRLGSDPGDIVFPPSPSKVSTTTPAKDSQGDESNRQPSVEVSEHEHEQHGNEQADHESPQLPRHCRRSQRVIGVEETQFLPIEPYYSSSTQDPESSHSGGLDNALVSEPNMNTSKTPSSDDPPEFISSRPVRKRKRSRRGSQQTPVPKVKVEDLGSSSPIITRTLHASESLDLDEIGDKVMTPRKRRRAFQPYVEGVENEVENGIGDEMLLDAKTDQRNQARTPVTIGQPRMSYITPSSNRGKSSATKPLQPLSTNDRILPNTVDHNLPTKRHGKPNNIIKRVEDILEDGGSTSRLKTPASAGKGSIQSVDLLDNLLSISPPTKFTSHSTRRSEAPEVRSVILPRSKLSKETTKHRVYRQKIADGASRFPKYDDLNQQDTRTSVPDKIAVLSHEENRMNSKSVDHSWMSIREELYMLEESASVSNQGDEIGGSIASEELSPERATKASRESTRSPSNSASKVEPKISKLAKTTKRRPKGVAGKGLDSDDAEQEPYRLRPVGTLKLDHFKINPNFNQGYDYAYTEVVRGKDRQCLAGCVREECCGKQFGVLAQALYPVRDNPTISERAEENALLREYLGNNKHKIRIMGIEERMETLAQARKWKISNKMGKHRSVVPRRNTPPGFWEADFPNTQEDEVLRKKQKQIEREKVAERYAEAMRPGGAWLFKDE